MTENIEINELISKLKTQIEKQDIQIKGLNKKILITIQTLHQIKSIIQNTDRIDINIQQKDTVSLLDQLLKDLSEE